MPCPRILAMKTKNRPAKRNALHPMYVILLLLLLLLAYTHIHAFDNERYVHSGPVSALDSKEEQLCLFGPQQLSTNKGTIPFNIHNVEDPVAIIASAGDAICPPQPTILVQAATMQTPTFVGSKEATKVLQMPYVHDNSGSSACNDKQQPSSYQEIRKRRRVAQAQQTFDIEVARPGNPKRKKLNESLRVRKTTFLMLQINHEGWKASQLFKSRIKKKI